MRRFVMETSIVLPNDEDIVDALRKIADEIENGSDYGDIPGENQCQNWYVEEDDGEYDDDGYEEDDDETEDDYYNEEEN